MDDTEFLQMIVKTNQDFVANQIAMIRRDLNKKIATLERKLKALEEENHQKDQIIAKLNREIPLQVKTVMKDVMQADVRTLEDHPERGTTQQVESAHRLLQRNNHRRRNHHQKKKRNRVST